jgi:hypothetical protein
MALLKRESATSIREEKGKMSKEVIGLSQKKGVWDTLKTRMIDFAVLGIRPPYMYSVGKTRIFLSFCSGLSQGKICWG